MENQTVILKEQRDTDGTAEPERQCQHLVAHWITQAQRELIEQEMRHAQKIGDEAAIPLFMARLWEPCEARTSPHDRPKPGHEMVGEWVRTFPAKDPGMTIFEGLVVGYQAAPTFTIKTLDGQTVSWQAALTARMQRPRYCPHCNHVASNGTTEAHKG